MYKKVFWKDSCLILMEFINLKICCASSFCVTAPSTARQHISFFCSRKSLLTFTGHKWPLLLLFLSSPPTAVCFPLDAVFHQRQWTLEEGKKRGSEKADIKVRSNNEPRNIFSYVSIRLWSHDRSSLLSFKDLIFTHTLEDLRWQYDPSHSSLCPNDEFLLLHRFYTTLGTTCLHC